jgi:hypothetical protein
MLPSGAARDAGAQESGIGGAGNALGTLQRPAGAFGKADPGADAVSSVPNLGTSGAQRALRVGTAAVLLP